MSLSNVNIEKAIKELAPDAQWALGGESLEGLIWLDENISQPSDQEIIDKIQEIEQKEILEFNKSAAKILRDSTIESDIEVHGVMWQIDKASRDKIHEATSYAERTQNTGSSRSWILADNTIRDTSYQELLEVLNAYVERMDRVFGQYTTWSSGDTTQPFTIY